MASVLTVVPTCDNCISVDSSSYYLAVNALAAAGVLLGIGILVLSRRAPTKPRVWAGAAAVCLGIGLPVTAAVAHFPISAHGAVCGGALHAARTRGFPTDAALDPTQRACKDQGQTVLDAAILIGTAAVIGATVMTVAARRATSPARRDRVQSAG